MAGEAATETKAEAGVSFDDFYLKEYERISEAYFSTRNSISEFMRHFLAVASLPPAVVVLFGRSEQGNQAIAKFIQAHPLPIPVVLFLIAGLGMCMAAYVIGLHHDAVLYARHVNCVRGYFEQKVGVQTIRPQMILPNVPVKPSFSESKLRYIVWTFALVNGGYAIAAAYALWYYRPWEYVWLVWVVPPAVLVWHRVHFRKVSAKQERDWVPRTI